MRKKYHNRKRKKHKPLQPKQHSPVAGPSCINESDKDYECDEAEDNETESGNENIDDDEEESDDGFMLSVNIVR